MQLKFEVLIQATLLNIHLRIESNVCKTKSSNKTKIILAISGFLRNDTVICRKRLFFECLNVKLFSYIHASVQ